jgi:hypothetical protein
MPELRALVEHLVKTTVERSVTAQLERQGERQRDREGERRDREGERRELEATLKSALAPLLDRQRELENALGDLRRADPRPPDVPGRAPDPVNSLGSVARAEPPPALRAAPLAPAVAAPPRAMARPLGSTSTSAHDAAAAWDIPAELNGSRRKRAVNWILGLAGVLLLLSAAGLSVLSNTGTYL